MSTSNAALNLDGSADTVDLTGPAFHTVICVDHLCLAALDLEYAVRADLDAPSASGTTVRHEHQGVSGLLDVYLVVGLDQ
jgi:hypothetical protein